MKIFSTAGLFFYFIATAAHAQWGKAPAGWGDFAIGLTDDATKLAIITTAKGVPTQLHYRVRYINGGVDIASNWYSWATGGGSIATNFINDSKAIGMQAAFNIYMLQEDAGAAVAISNMQNATFMQKYFWNIRDVANKANGNKCAFIVEPDTWGYLIKNCYPSPTAPGSNDPTIRPNLVTTCNLSALGFPELVGSPNTMAGVAQGIIKMIRIHAPDAVLGFHTNHWATWSNGATGASCLGTNCGGFYTCQAGMPFWSTGDIDAGADFQIAWYKELFGGATSCDRGDFLVVEKYGFDEGGRWAAFGASRTCLYYGATQYQNWLRWSKRMGQGINLPLLGWQIPVGHTGLPNAINQYEDTFMEYFFAHKSEFYCAGFIGLFMGPGVGQSTLYTNGAGSGDGGWFFSNLRTQLDPTRPINMNVSTNGCGGTITVTPGCSSLPLDLISFSAERKNEGTEISWVTANEINVVGFTLEKSTDGVHFSPIEYLNAGNKAGGYSFYSVYDDQFTARRIYYRLKETDTDGKAMESRIISIQNNYSSSVKIYPNPASGKIFVTLSGFVQKDYSFRIFNSLGSEVFSADLQTAQNEISLSTLPSSLYLYKVFSPSGEELEHGKLMLE
ncbi:MAG: T9SS type A sorting domain-containing protein [Cytophagaceae bacterium]